MIDVRMRDGRRAVRFGAVALCGLLVAPAGALGQDYYLAGQEPVMAANGQFADDGLAVAETNMKLDIFGGGDENGGMFGGAPSLALPLGGSLGLQIDGVAGFVADEAGFAGGAAHLFYRNPQVFALGVAGGGYVVESKAQYAVAAIAEYYLDNITLEALGGFQWGDVVHDSFYGRVGASLFLDPNLRIGAGVGYGEDTELTGDVQIEALMADVPGMALFASGVIDEEGALALAGVRFYSAAAGVGAPRPAGSELTLIDITRRYIRPNFLTSYTGFGLRQISLAGGDKLPIQPPSPPTPPDDPDVPNGDTDPGGLITLVQNTVDNLLNNTPLEGVGDLVDALVDPETGLLAALTRPLDAITNIETGALGAVTEVVDTVAGPTNGLLDPTLDAVNDLLSGDTRSTTNGGLIDLVQGTVGNLLDNTPLAFVGNLVDALVDPQTGALAALTGPLNDLTDIDSGGLGAVTELVDTLAGPDKGLLDPTLDAVNDLLGGPSAAADNDGLIDVVEGTVGNLLGDTPLAFVGDLVVGLVDPQGGVLSPLTAPLNDITRGQSGTLGPVTTLVDNLAGADQGALDPTLDGVNRLLGF